MGVVIVFEKMHTDMYRLKMTPIVLRIWDVGPKFAGLGWAHYI